MLYEGSLLKTNNACSYKAKGKSCTHIMSRPKTNTDNNNVTG